MDFLKTQLARIQQQLGGLTASQRMLSGTLVVIMVMTLYWWTRYASQADMEPVLNQAIAPEELSRITNELQAKGIPYKMQGDRITVPSDRRAEAFATLAYSQLLPHNFKDAFDEMISKSNPLDPQSKTNVLFNQAKEMNLSQIIRDWPGVAHAFVVIDSTKQRSIGEASIEPSASVNITMRSGMKADKKLVDAAAVMVSGAVASVAKGRVHVIIDGVTHHVTNDDDGSYNGGTWLEYVKECDSYFAQKLQKQLFFIDGAMVAVTVDPDFVRKEVKKRLYGNKPLVRPLETKSKTEEISTQAAPASEPGVAANTSASITPGAGGGETHKSTIESEDVKNLVLPDETVINEIGQSGAANIKSASVYVPRSYFVRVYKSRHGDSQEPDEAALQTLIAPELEQLKTSSRACLGLTAEQSLSVAVYSDLMPATPVAAAQPAAASSIGLVLGGHVKEIAVGALALISLFMMSTMVKKSSPAPATVAATPAPKERSPLLRPEEVVAEVGEGDAMLDGMEINEETVKAQQMIDQVDNMVKDNPDAAANLIKRWMNRV